MHWFKVFLKEGYEGLMFRNADSRYLIDGRSFNLLKLKPWKDCEATVYDFQEGTKRLTGTLGALMVNMEDKKFKVGSGFTDEQRDYIWENQDKYLGSQLTVKYQELTKYGIPRFPTFLRWA
jgi:DNA ligase-1